MKKNYLILILLMFFFGNISAETTTSISFESSLIVPPSFTQVAPICSGATLAPLPTTSNDGVAGTWSPAINNLATTTYTFTPTLAGGETATMTIVVNPLPTATFGANPFPICAGTSTLLSANVATANASVNYNNLAGAPQTVYMNKAAFGPTLTAPLVGQLVNAPNNGCLAFAAGSLTGKIVLIQRGVCSFAIKAQNAQDAGAIGVILYNNATAPAFLPGGTSATVTIPVFGITLAEGQALIAAMTASSVAVTLNPAAPLTYLWSNGATTQSFNSGILNVDTTFSVTITNTVTGCVRTQSVNAAVTPNIVPTFVQIAPLCAGTTAPILPTTSTNTTPLAGTWLPAVVDNTTVGPTTYTFTPTPVTGQCLTTATMVINVIANTTSTSTIAACDNYTWAANNVTYTTGGTYTFVDVCETKTLVLTIAPSSEVVTTVTECATYTWANNGQVYTTSGTYTGTTTNCVTQKLNLTITPLVVPTFTQVASICFGDTLAALPTTSINGVAGTWSPSINAAATTTYAFTPTSTVCTGTATMTIAVNTKPFLEFFFSADPVCAGTSTTIVVQAPNLVTTINYLDASGTAVVANANTALFGTPATSPLNGTLVDVVNNGCAPLPAGSLSGKIALIKRGACAFTLKAQNAQDAGAIAVVVYNNAPAIDLTPSGTAPGLTIPVYAIRLEAGEAIIASMTAGQIPFTVTPPALTYAWNNGVTTNSFVSPVLTADTPYTVTVTNTATGCSTTSTVNVAVTPNIVPTFVQIAPICAGSTAPTLPTTSTNATPVAGTWFPPTVDNTTPGPTTYVFTPTPVAGECLVTATMIIDVVPTTTTPLIVNTCNNTYTWPENNVTYTTGGTYSFVDVCTTKTLVLTITPSSEVLTTVTECATYTWANNGQVYTTSGTYTGTTTNCVTQKLNLTITPLVVPTFTQVAGICTGDALAPLPTTSTNGVAGTWSPAINAAATTTYAFTPTSTVCTGTATMTIAVNPKPVLAFFSNPFPVCAGTTAVLSVEASNIVTTVNYTDAFGVNVSSNANVAQFGAALTSPLSGILVDVVNNGCAPLPAGSLAGKIALIKRGACAFTIKAQNAQDAGAIAVVVYNNAPAADLTPAGTAPGITIPVYAVRLEVGDALIASMTAGQIPVTLVPAPILTYSWTNGATTKAFTTPVLTADTPFTVTVTNPATGCFTTSTVNVTVTAAPVITGSANQSFAPTATISNIVVVSPTAVVWYATAADATAGTNALLATQVLTNAATYYAVSTVGTCKSAPFAVTVDTSLANTDFDANTTLKVYPNPFNNVVNVSINSKATIEIFDVVGKSIQNLSIENGLSQIDLERLASGVYMMKVVNENNQSKTVRLVKK